MTAKEMFEKLGFDLITNESSNTIKYRREKKPLFAKNERQFIEFDKEINRWVSHSIVYYDDYKGEERTRDSFIVFDKETTKAILRQLEELGWLNK